jgi:hypothetical protein
MTPFTNITPDKRGLVGASRVIPLHQTKINTFLYHKKKTEKIENSENP